MDFRTASECTDAELDAMLRGLTAKRRTGAHLEIGAAAGGSLKRLMLAYPPAERPKFVVIDPLSYFPQQRETIEANLRSVGIDPGTVEFRVEKSFVALKAALQTGERYDFMHIDGDHALRAITEDLRWTRLLTPGGVFCVHDYEPYGHMVIPSVKIAVDRFLKRRANYRLVELVRSMAVIEKLGEGPPEINDAELAEARIQQMALRWSHSLRKRLRVFGA